MMLVDTSVWVDHFRHGDTGLAGALEAGQVGMLSFVLGELACGNLRSRAEVLSLLQALPRMPASSDQEALQFIEQHELMGAALATSMFTCWHQRASAVPFSGRDKGSTP